MREKILLTLLFFAFQVILVAQIGREHPCLILTKDDVSSIRAELGKIPLLDKTFYELKAKIDAEILRKIDVPVPKDPAGGYTHEKHKQNYLTMQGAGILWQLTGENKYADYVREILFEYANLYPKLGLHPVDKSYAPGKLFWQSLNEAVWLVYTSQAYDCIYDYLEPSEREQIEKDLLIPYADFLSIESPDVFNRIHNHGVWAVAAVGMAGFAMENEEISSRAFSGVPPFTNESGSNPGFFSQIDKLFSPDGYYTEGPYYQRYALLPFMLFAQAIDNNMPEVKIFDRRDSVLQKAVLTVLQLTSSDGKFFPINDAMKDMSYMAPELVTGLDIVYNQNPSNCELLSIAIEQDEVILSGAGLKVAKDIANNKAKPFNWKSIELADGSDGDEGAIGILRSSQLKDGQCIVMKYPAQGMGHGHFDRLSILYYDNANEIIQDYGAARFVNVFYKSGGRYLPENESWAKQTVAHNTVVVDSVSQFSGNTKEASNYHSDKWVFNNSKPEIQVMSAKENNAYKGVSLHRTIALITDTSLLICPLIIDLFRIESENEHVYDLPFYYHGQIMYTNLDYNSYTESRKPLGTKNGYQHLWVEAEGKSPDKTVRILYLNNNRFYSINSESNQNTQVYLTRIGANDPEFNLRNEPGLLIRQRRSKDHIFVSTIESHGRNNPLTELTSNLISSVKNIRTVLNNSEYTVIEIETHSNKIFTFAIANSNNDPDATHDIIANNKKYRWQGVYRLLIN